MEMDFTQFGQQVYKHRHLHNWTQETLAAKAGISTPFLGHIEWGTRKPSVETLVALANALEVGTDDLLRGSLCDIPLDSSPAYSEVLHQIQTLREEMKTRWSD